MHACTVSTDSVAGTQAFQMLALYGFDVRVRVHCVVVSEWFSMRHESTTEHPQCSHSCALTDDTYTCEYTCLPRRTKGRREKCRAVA